MSKRMELIDQKCETSFLWDTENMVRTQGSRLKLFIQQQNTW